MTMTLMTAMTFEERQNAIGALLREEILPRYARPSHLGDETARAELRDMVNELNADWPSMGRTEFEETARRLAREIRRTHEGRSWPSIKRLLTALDAALKGRAASSAASAEENPQHYAGAVEWWLAHRSRCPWAREHHAVRMVEEGIATREQLWRAGWDVPREWAGEILGWRARDVAIPDKRHADAYQLD